MILNLKWKKVSVLTIFQRMMQSIIFNVLTLIWESKSDKTNRMYQYCFELLICQTDPLLNEEQALLMTNLLNILKSILKDKDYQSFYSYSLTRLKQRLVKYCSLEICFGEVRGKNIQIKFFTVRPLQFLRSSKWLRIVKGNERIANWLMNQMTAKAKILKRAANILNSDN